MNGKICVIIGALLIFATVAVLGCTAAPDPQTNAITPTPPVVFGNGVYYFPQTDQAFGEVLSGFIGNNPDLQLITIAPNDNNLYGHTSGYFAVFKKVEGKL
jgi:hypothetical protein